jgi:hypothetical protein
MSQLRRLVVHLGLDHIQTRLIIKQESSFYKIAKDMASNVIKALYQGELSNPPGISWYTPLLTTDGKAKIDKDGLHF